VNSELLARIEGLPEESRQVLLALLDLLVEKADAAPPRKRVFAFDWEGGLAGGFAGATSVEFQHRASEWR
jgi:hypothetical protein